MKIFKIEVDLDNDWDCYDSFVIVANNEQEARRVAAWEQNSAESKQAWYSTPLIYQCGDYTGSEKRPFILCSSFNAS